MKITTVKKISDIKSGLYIRAVINYRGNFWAETIRIYGKPFVVNEKTLGKCWKVMSSCSYSREYFCSSLSSKISGYGKKFGTALIPFSNKVYNRLNQIRDLKEFAETINQERISDNEYDEAVADFNFQKYLDEERERMYEIEMEREYAANTDMS